MPLRSRRRLRRPRMWIFRLGIDVFLRESPRCKVQVQDGARWCKMLHASKEGLVSDFRFRTASSTSYADSFRKTSWRHWVNKDNHWNFMVQRCPCRTEMVEGLQESLARSKHKSGLQSCDRAMMQAQAYRRLESTTICPFSMRGRQERLDTDMF